MEPSERDKFCLWRSGQENLNLGYQQNKPGFERLRTVFRWTS